MTSPRPSEHEYQPDPRTARCTYFDQAGYCESVRVMGGCSWCGHPRREHTGRPDPVVKLHLSKPDPNAGHGLIPADARISTVKWSTSACSAKHCACKTYER